MTFPAGGGISRKEFIEEKGQKREFSETKGKRALEKSAFFRAEFPPGRYRRQTSRIYCRMRTLDSLRAGECAKIEEITAPGEVRERLKMLNVFPGANVRLVKAVFFRSTYLLEANGVRVGLRRNLAARIRVRTEEEETK